jgi:hypothetical protein
MLNVANGKQFAMRRHASLIRFKWRIAATNDHGITETNALCLIVRQGNLWQAI